MNHFEYAVFNPSTQLTPLLSEAIDNLYRVTDEIVLSVFGRMDTSTGKIFFDIIRWAKPSRVRYDVVLFCDKTHCNRKAFIDRVLILTKDNKIIIEKSTGKKTYNLVTGEISHG